MPTPPGFAEASLQLTLTGLARPAYITFGVNPTATDPQVVCQDIANAVDDAGSLLSIFDSSVVISQVRVSLGTDGGEDLVGVLGLTMVGPSSVTTLPPNCAMLVHKVTARGGRRGRGRLFIPWCLSDSWVDEAGIIDTANVTTRQTAMGVWRAAMSTNQVPLVLLHKTGQTSPGAPDTITSLVVDKLISTQRRRLGRR